MTNAWQQNTTARTDSWTLQIEARTYCHVTQYEGTNDYCAQAVRKSGRIGEIVVGRQAAMSKAEEMIALPIEEFNRMVISELTDQLVEIGRQILSISPTAKILPGYHLGFEDGIEHMRNKIAKAIAEHPRQQEVA